MFVLNLKLKNSKKFFTVFAAVSVALAIICVGALVYSQSKPRDTANSEAIGEYSLKAENSEQIEEFLSQFGIEADITGSTKKKVTIPREFNDTYLAYNKLQQHAGLDLSRYSGKTVDHYRIPIQSDKANFAVLLVYQGYVIGGHLTNGEYGEENQPLI